MDTFHGLKLLTHCGGGAYGDVYYCEDISGRKMAVKIVSKKRLGDSWERELRGVVNYRKITENAPGLLQIFHVEEDEESFFYTMESADSVSDTGYVPDTLAYRLQSGALPQADMLRILSGIFDGIKLIHNAGFTHRDIKPDNILFVKGVPKLADIGLLSSLSNSMTQLAGTLDFIPPEERGAASFESSDKLSRQRNDLYAFGKVVYCAVTGMSPHEYPTVPKDLPLSLPLKYFLRLAFQLCSKDPVKRLNSIEDLNRDFSDIERKLLYGETLLDKLKYGTKQFVTALKSAFFSSLRFIKRYWYLVFLFLLIGGGVAYWLLKPKEPFDITKQKNKEYTNTEYNISMKIPVGWEIASKETVNKMVKKNKISPEMLGETIKSLKHVKTGFFCDTDLAYSDNVTILAEKFPAKYLETVRSLPIDEWRITLKAQYENLFKVSTIIYDSKKLTVAGYPAIFFDFSINPNARIVAYWIVTEDRMIFISMSAKVKTFRQRQEEFNSVLTTLKIGK